MSSRTSGDTATVDILHGKCVDSRLPYYILLTLIKIAQSYNRTPIGINLGTETAYPDKFSRTFAQDACQRHTVHISAYSGFRGIHIRVRIDPQQAKRSVLMAHGGSRTGNRSSRQTVISSKT